MRRFSIVAWALALGLSASSAWADETPPPDAPAPSDTPQPPPGYAPPAPPPPYPQPQQPGYGNYPQQQPGYGNYPQQQPGYGNYPQQQPGYAQPGYYPQAYYNVPPPPGPPPPPKPIKPACCRWSLRFDPFDLLFRRLTFQGELAIAGPISIEIAPSWIFGSPYENFDAAGFSIGGNLAWYFLSGKALKGLWLKAHVGYENYDATLTNPALPSSSDTKTASSAVLGGMIGTTSVFGRNGGFAISGGIGIGVATADEITLVAPGDALRPGYAAKLYDKSDRIRLLGSLGLGIAF